MKKIIFLLFCLLIVNWLYSQDFAPGQQAQGYLNGKNVTMDYSTGIFHYKVPLYTLGSGGFSLPISADYAAKGVKVDDLPGLLGYNWTLNTGGIVSRTIRGGIEDEKEFFGYLWSEHVAVPLENDQKKVHMHERDGECDIFTAVFNGRSVNFIIRMTADHQVYAEPLEQTDVKIECEFSFGPVLDGWVITDEAGNRFIYRQKEWTTNVYKEEAISLNGIRNKSFISSWYLSRIEPVNNAPVVFNYRTEVNINEKQENIVLAKHRYDYHSTYYYGRPLSERALNFGKYDDEFRAEIRRAKSYLEVYSWEIQLENPLTIFAGSQGWVFNPAFGNGIDAFEKNTRIMGQLSNFEYIGKASNELIGVLENLYQTYSHIGSHSTQMAASCFRYAKELVIQSIEDVDYNITKRKVSNLTSFDVRSPMLDNICCTDKMVKFGYYKLGSKSLTNLQLCNLNGEKISEICLELVGFEKMWNITFMDKDSVEIQRIDFEYYPYPEGNYKIDYDICGYPVSADHSSEILDNSLTKISSLKMITLPDGGKINLDYERNQVGIPSRLDSLNSRRANRYCGVRLKSLIFTEASSQSSDTVYYRYPLPGFWVYESVSSQEEVQYRHFMDLVISSRAKFKGLAFLNTGNNGLYYRCVEEVVPGHGTQVYHFHVPLLNASAGYKFYPFWLTALPLGVASYDKNGNLKRLVKNKYITSWDFDNQIADWTSFENRSYFVDDARFYYTRNLPQVKAYEYYMDANYLEKYYRDLKDIVLYRDGGSSGILNPYRDIYTPNIEPRTTVVIPDSVYSLCYGGKTLLQRQSEYHFDNIVTTQPDISDFSREASGILYKQTEYFYDHPTGTLNPTRIVTTDSRGDVYTTLIKRVGDMTDAVDVAVARMKAANIKALPVKKVYLKNNLLQKEQVFVYTASDTSGRFFSGIKEEWTYVPEREVSVSTTFPDPLMFTYGRDKYLRDGEYEYCQKGDFFLPVEIKERSGKEAVCYDFNTGRSILQVSQGSADMIMAVDFQKNLDTIPENLPENISNQDIFDSFKILGRDSRIIASVSTDSYFLAFTRTRRHQGVLETIDALLGLDSVRFNQLKNSVSISGYFAEFLDWYFDQLLQYGEYVNADRFRYASRIVQRAMNSPEIFNSDFWSFASDYVGGSSSDGVYVLKNLAGNTKFKMYALTGRNKKVYYTIMHQGGTTRKFVETTNVSFCPVQAFDIDLSSYGGITSVTVEVSALNDDFDYLALLPADAEFEATSYNMDGTVFARFDQTGRLELNEYDSGGRLIRVKDGKGNILQEYQYNVANNQ